MSNSSFLYGRFSISPNFISIFGLFILAILTSSFEMSIPLISLHLFFNFSIYNPGPQPKSRIFLFFIFPNIFIVVGVSKSSL